MKTQRVIVTAGASGIGRCIAEGFAAQGAQVHLCDLMPADWADAGQITPTIVDVRDASQVTRWIDAATKAMGGCDVLVNNAGIAGQADPVEDLDLEQWNACLSVNLTAQMLTCRALAPVMKAQGAGSIINMSSTSGLFGVPYRAPYVAAKWGVIGFTKTLAGELGPYGIRVNAICPGAVSGDRMDRVLAAEAQARGVTSQAVEADYASGSSLRRFARPEEIADLCLYLASPAAAFVSGQAIAVDGHTETYHSA